MSLPLFFAIYCLEAGVIFTVVPWTRMWTSNPLLHGNLGLAAFADNPFVRGFVSGFGIVHLIIGIKDLIHLRRAAAAAAAATGQEPR